MRKRTSMARYGLFGLICAQLLVLLPALQLASVQASTQPSAVGNTQQSPKPVGLRVELLSGASVNDIKDEKPEFSWQIAHSAIQTAFQIQVYELPRAGAESLLWDSSKVLSSQSLSQEYKGIALLPERRYSWRVRAWTKDASQLISQSQWSDFQIFTSARFLGKRVSTYPQVISTVNPKSVTKLPSGNYLIDFGKVAFGYLELHLRSDQNGTVNVTLAERGDKSRAIPKQDERSSVRYYTVPLKVFEKYDSYRVNPPKDKRNTKSDKAIPIPGRFGRISPFRFVEIDPQGLNLTEISATQIFIHYPFDDLASSFVSSNDVLNGIWDLSKYTMKATSFAGVYVDGDRERIPYEADAYINQLSHYAVDAQYSMARKTHEYLLSHPTWPTEWKQHSIMMAWTDWMYTGDIEALKDNYAVLKEQKLLRFLANRDGLLESYPNGTHQTSKDIVDWPIGERDGFEFKDVNTVVNAFHYLNLMQMAEIASVIGFTQDAVLFRAQAKQLYQAFNEQLFSSESGLYVDGVGSEHSSAHANILPLAVGLVPKNRADKVVEYVKSTEMAVSVYFAQYLLEAMYKHGQQEHAFALLSSKALRSWYNMIRVGSTITLEAWDDQFKPNQDWNHAWGAVPANITSRYILGVKPLTAGFEQVSIAPHLAGLTHVKGTVPTIRGPIKIGAVQEALNTILKLDIPGNTNAILTVPTSKDKSIVNVIINGKQQALNKLGQLKQAVLPAGYYQVNIVYETKQ